jgi:hypothetical protein
VGYEGESESIQFDVTPGTDYFIIVDAYSHSGPYQLTVDQL